MRYAFATFLLCVLSSASLADDLLIFSSDVCAPCQQLHAALKNDPTIVDGFKVVYYEISRDRAAAAKYGITVVPTLIVIDDNGRQRRKTGFTGVADLRRWLRRTR